MDCRKSVRSLIALNGMVEVGPWESVAKLSGESADAKSILPSPQCELQYVKQDRGENIWNWKLMY